MPKVSTVFKKKKKTVPTQQDVTQTSKHQLGQLQKI